MSEHSALHGHGRDAPTPVRGARLLVALVALLVAATAVGMLLLWPPGDAADGARPADGVERVKGTVTAARQVPCSQALPGAAELEELGDAGYVPDPDCHEVTVRVDEGPDAGFTFRTLTGDDHIGRVGRSVVLYRVAGAQGPEEAGYSLADVQRRTPLLALSALFLLSVLALGRLRGALAVVGLGVSLVVLVTFLVPALLAGRPPVLTAVVGASAVMIVVLLLAHGPNLRTATAMLGTAGALLLTLLLATVFVELAGLSGLTSDEAAYVEATFGDVDLRGLLLAGIVIGALGILDDVTVTQVSTTFELRAADPAMPRRRLYAAALRVGRDHIASLINTLLLAYAGASMPLFVIVTTSGTGLGETLTSGVVAEEVVRTLVGSIGLVAAVPLTTALAAAMCPPTAAGPAVVPAGDEPGRDEAARAVSASRFFDEEQWSARAGREMPERTDE